jgi:hypothetical protein
MAAVVRCLACRQNFPPAPTDGGPLFSFCMSCTSDRLSEHAAAVAMRLLPNGHWQGHLWRAGSTAGEEGQSLAVECSGKGRGHWTDYAGAERGDLLDLVALSPHSGCNGDRLRALRWAHDFLRAPPPPPSTAAVAARRRQPTTEEIRAAVARIWREARPLASGDEVWRYLAGRGIDLARLPALPSLRAHPGLRHPSKRVFPAMIAAVASPDGARIAAIHRTWLAVEDGRVVKAPVEPAKMSLGDCHGGCIPLTRGASGRLWRDPEPGELVAVGEGLEDSLSIAVAKPAWRVVCGVSLSNMLGMVLPAAIAQVILIGQNDADGSKAAQLLPRVARHFQAMRKEVQILRPRDRGTKDVNELTQRLRRRLGAPPAVAHGAAR